MFDFGFGFYTLLGNTQYPILNILQQKDDNFLTQSDFEIWFQTTLIWGELTGGEKRGGNVKADKKKRRGDEKGGIFQ